MTRKDAPHNTHTKEEKETETKKEKEKEKKRSTVANLRYLFDWSLPLYAPELATELTIPIYFANDMLRKTPPGAMYQDSWPSLFIAPAGLRSELHIDTFGSNFWMALFRGRKRWVFFRKEETHLLYPTYVHGLDPVFQVDLKNPDLKAHPLLALAQPIECVLEAGELIFVPNGCAHWVENIETSVAVSGNFVDESNIDAALEELGVAGLLDPRANELHNELLALHRGAE